MKSSKRSKKVKRFARVPTRAEINQMLQNTDWQAYWITVSKRVEKEVEAFALARAKSFAHSRDRFFSMCSA